MKTNKDWGGIIGTLLAAVFFMFLASLVFLKDPHTFDSGVVHGIFICMASWFLILSFYINLKSKKNNKK